MVVGRPALIARLLVWAVAVVVIDAAVIATADAGDKSPTRTAPTTSTTTTVTTNTLPGEASASTESTASGASETSTPAPTQTTSSTIITDSGGEIVVAHLHEDGDTSSSVAFHVEGRWQMRWRVDQGGNGVAATVDDDDTGKPKTFAGFTPGEGSTDVPTGCNCTLHLTPDGSAYDVLVVDVEG